MAQDSMKIDRKKVSVWIKGMETQVVSADSITIDNCYGNLFLRKGEEVVLVVHAGDWLAVRVGNE